MEDAIEATAPQVSRGKRAPERLGELVTHLEKEGANFTRIARLMGENPATVRYWFKERLVKRGFTLQGLVKHQAIGLTRVAATVRVSETYAPLALKVFELLSESAYLVYQEALIDGTHILEASVPVELVEAYHSFLMDLKSIGFLDEVVNVVNFEWFRKLPMKVHRYDFASEAWELDLEKSVPRAEVKVAPPKLEKFDKTDLLILRRIQVEQSASVRRIARELGLNYKKVLRHYRHVRSRGLIAGYYVRWMKTVYNPRTQKARTVRHAYLPLRLYVRNVRGLELEKLMLQVHRLPFVWAEEGGPDYFAFIPVPLTLANEVLSYLHGISSEFYGRASISVVDVNGAFTYTIIPGLYDQKYHRWTFDPQATLNMIRNLVPVAKP